MPPLRQAALTSWTKILGRACAVVTAASLLAPPLLAQTPALTSASVVQEATALRRTGKFEQAFEKLQTWLQDHPDDAAALHELGVLYALHGQYPLAVAQLERALAIDPDRAETRRNLAEILRASDRCSDAVPHYQTLVTAEPAEPTALKGLVLCQQALGRYDAALKACAAIARLHPGTTLAQWAADRRAQIEQFKAGGALTVAQMEAEGRALFAEKRFADAAVWLGMALQAQPSADRAYRLAMAQVGARDLLAALGSLQRALDLDPKHTAALHAHPTVAKAVRNLGDEGQDVAFARLETTPARRVAAALVEGDLVLARQVLDAALQRPDGGAVLRLLDAEVWLRQGQISKAIASFQETLKLRPRHPAALKGVADAYVQQGRLQDARELANLPPPPAHVTLEAYLRLFVTRRRAEFDHQLRMAMDPGVRPQPALSQQVAAAVPAPPPPPPPAEVPPPEPAKSKGKGKGKRR